jgi:hypothetical protein
MLPATAQTENAAKARIAVIFFIVASLVAMRGAYAVSFKVRFPAAIRWYVSAHRVNTGWMVVLNGLNLSRLAPKPRWGYIHRVRAAIDIVEAVRAGRQRV